MSISNGHVIMPDMEVIESSLAQDCLARLLELPFVRDAQFLSAPSETGWDCVLQITTPEDTYELACWHRSGWTPLPSISPRPRLA